MRDELPSVFVYGQLRYLSRASLSESLVKIGARLVTKPRAADVVVVARRSLLACVAEDRLRLPFARPDAARLLSEDAIGRWLARNGRDTQKPGPYTAAEVGRLADLPTETCEALALFDVIGTTEAGFVYADLAVARQVATQLRLGVALSAIVKAAWTLAARGVPLSQVRLVEAPWGEIMHQVDGQIARLDGQFALVLDEGRGGAISSLAAAMACENAGDLHEAERLYHRAAQADRRDPVPVFNHGNVLTALGREAEAMIAFQQALARDPAFAEAAFNLAGLLERTGQPARARTLYRKTIAAHPRYAQAIYNLARLLTADQAFRDALPLWERFIALTPDDPDVTYARRAALLCRMEGR